MKNHIHHNKESETILIILCNLHFRQYSEY